MTAPAFLENVEQEEWNELDELTGQLAQPLGDADLDAVASQALHIMARADAELDRYAAAAKAEHERISARYMMLLLPHTVERGRAEETVKECARRAQFVSKSKSRKVGYGQYGRRTVPEKVSIVDKDKALEFAYANDINNAIKSKTEESVIYSVIVPLVLEQLRATGEIPPGFEHVGEHEEMYAKPLPLDPSVPPIEPRREEAA